MTMKDDVRALLRRHSEAYTIMALRTDRQKRITNPDGYGKRTGQCGDTVEMFLQVRGNRIDGLFFETDGCMNTTACANTVAELAVGNPVDKGWDMTPADIIQYLNTLPAEEHHCAELAVGAFYLALADLQKTRGSAWKHWYNTP